MKHSGIEAAQLNWINNVLTFKVNQPVATEQPIKDLVLASINYRTMHRQLMHASKDVVHKACEKAGIKITGSDKSFCESCHLGKATEQYPPCSTVPVDRPLAFVRVDSIGHTPIGHLGYKITVHFIDMYSGYHWIKFAKEKTDCFRLLKEWKKQVETQISLKVGVLGIDGGTEFAQAVKPFQRSKLLEWCKEEGIILAPTTPGTPWLNGWSERAGRTITERARTALLYQSVPERLWPFAEESVVIVTNLLPTRANPNYESPHERLAKALGLNEQAQFPYIMHLRSYLSTAYVYIKSKDRVQSAKMAPRAKKGLLIGYIDQRSHLFWIWLPEEG
jgi:hypothetical protein